MTEVWPGTPYPLGATLRRHRHQLRALLARSAERVELCLFDDDGAETRVELTEVDALRLARLPARRRARAALRLPRPRPVRPGARACAATRPSCCSTPTPRRSTATSTGTQSLFSLPTSTTPTQLQRPTTRAPYMPKSSWSTRSSTGATTGRRARPYNETVIYEAHVKGLTKLPPGRPRASCAAPTPASPTRRSSSTCTTLGVTAVELMPVHQFVARRAPGRARACATTGATTRSASSPRTPRYAAAGQRGQQVQEFKAMVKRAARGRHRGDPRRGLQPHRRGQPPRPDAVASAASTTPAYYRLVDDDRALLHGLHRHRQQPATCGTRTRCS